MKNSPKVTKYGVPFPAREKMVPFRALAPLPGKWKSLSAAFVHRARSMKSTLFALDSLGARVTYGDALVRASVLAHALKSKLKGQDITGILIPPSVGGSVANIAVTLLGKTTVNLNYASSSEVVNAAIKACKIKVVVASRRAVEKQGLKLDAEVIYLEDLARSITGADKAWGYLVANLVPAFLLGAFLPGMSRGLNDLATIMFTTGSTGDPKGVMLTHGNVLSNIHQINSHVEMEPNDSILGILPFFHSFGFTVTLWAIAVLGRAAAYHISPLDPRVVGKMLAENSTTLMACTPTLMRGYLARCTREQFKTVRWLLLGSEPLKPELARDIEDKLGIVPLEGFGCTELSPFVASNVPGTVVTPDGRTVPGNKRGTVGHLAPGTAVAIVDVSTGEMLPAGSRREGLIFISGPQVMKGYFNRPKETAEVLHDGIYCTGDIGFVDEDGFLVIVDRLDEFAKIGAEMVPLIRVSAAVRSHGGVSEMEAVVRRVPDESKGERLVVLYTRLAVTPQEVVARLNETDMPRLWIPKANDFHQVESFPVGPTGKLDLKALTRMAVELSKGR